MGDLYDLFGNNLADSNTGNRVESDGYISYAHIIIGVQGYIQCIDVLQFLELFDPISPQFCALCIVVIVKLCLLLLCEDALLVTNIPILVSIQVDDFTGCQFAFTSTDEMVDRCFVFDSEIQDVIIYRIAETALFDYTYVDTVILALECNG